jgi:hypothetical protein
MHLWSATDQSGSILLGVAGHPLGQWGWMGLVSLTPQQTIPSSVTWKVQEGEQKCTKPLEDWAQNWHHVPSVKLYGLSKSQARNCKVYCKEWAKRGGKFTQFFCTLTQMPRSKLGTGKTAVSKTNTTPVFLEPGVYGLWCSYYWGKWLPTVLREWMQDGYLPVGHQCRFH